MTTKELDRRNFMSGVVGMIASLYTLSFGSLLSNAQVKSEKQETKNAITLTRFPLRQFALGNEAHRRSCGLTLDQEACRCLGPLR